MFERVTKYFSVRHRGARDGEMQMMPYQFQSSETDAEVNTNPLFIVGYYIVLSLAWVIVMFTLPLSLIFIIKVVHEYKRMVS